MMVRLTSGAADVDRIGRELRLTTKQIHWAKLYASGAHGYNVSKITMEAYPNANYGTAAIQGGQNLRHPCIAFLMDMIYVINGVTHLSIDKEVIKALKQDENYPAKVQAAKLLNEMSGRLEHKLIIETPPPKYDFSVLNPDQLRTYIELTELLEQSIKNKPIPIEGRTIIENGISEGDTLQEEPL